LKFNKSSCVSRASVAACVCELSSQQSEAITRGVSRHEQELRCVKLPGFLVIRRDTCGWL